ncbi:pyridine nucleotide-disulfide oxidoreductase [Rhodoferax koreense]|uniref:Pyridine nucleotide-disulfide oxidoreductase n=1 Tax=Rhodoferax koreensis TaxID=1842727 RepID=A0A1P8JW05_9BURK|nr:FAD/NAD(P)-binding oxidoreductase [Rhodoferax koreense]APW37925.1 pyridine nucleotide-disulfide oxidoreductase [Rhodoferax koreense]
MSGSAIEHCDVLIIGAGPAGLAAALAAAPSGAHIVIVDDNPAPGGQIWRDGPGVELPIAAMQRRNAIARCANIRLVSGTRVIAATAPSELLLEDAERGWRIGWKKLILCTGARELLLPFPGWTLPGVTGAGALQALVKSGLPVAGERIVIAGSGPLLLAAAATARKAGAHVVRIAEQAGFQAVAGFAAALARWPGKAVQSLGLFDASYRTGRHVLSAQGDGHVEAVRLRRGTQGEEVIACDRLACGFGLVPNTELGQHLGCAVEMRHGAPALTVDAMQATSRADIYAAGENTGVGGSDRALVQGAMAGHAAVGAIALAEARRGELARWDAFAATLHQRFALAEPLRRLAAPDTLVCRCEDVRHAELAPRNDWTDAKLHTRCGMGACQGRVCGAATRFMFGWAPTAPRPPLSPVRVATLAALHSQDHSAEETTHAA